MKFLVDESVEFPVVNFLRKKGFNVTSVVEDYRTIEDEKVLAVAVKEGRILITNDKDFGELIYLKGLPYKGIILFRLREESAERKIKLLEKLLAEFAKKIPGKFVVVNEKKVRFRK